MIIKNIRLLCWLLAIGLLISGCSETVRSSTMLNGHTNPTSQSAGTNIEKIEGIPEVASPGNDLVSYDPDRDIYFTCENVNLDIYGDTSHSTFSFYIFSKKPLDVEKIEVRLPIESQYNAMVYEYQFERVTSYMAEQSNMSITDTFPRNLFKTYCGMEFVEMGELMCWLNEKDHLTHPDYAHKEKQYQELLGMYEFEFQNLKSEDLPEIYKYEVTCFIPSKTRVNESFDSIDIVIDGVIHHQEIGIVRLTTERIPLDYPKGDYDYWGKIVWGKNITVYTDGMDSITPYDIKMKEDAILYRLHVINESVEIVELRLRIDGKLVDWNGNEPFQVYAGETVSLQVVYKSAYFENLFHNMIVYFELDAMIDGEMQAWPAQIHNDCYHTNPYLINAIVFDGLDVSSMFRDYTYKSVSSWQYFFPELYDRE